MAVVWAVRPDIWVDRYQSFGETSYLYFQGRKHRVV
jgi:hypothetical protein